MNAKGRIKTMDIKGQLLKPREVANRLNIALSTVYSFAQHGVLPCLKLGRSVRFREESISKLLDQRETVALDKAA